MDYRSLMKNSFSEMRKYSSQTVMVTQSFTSFGRYKPRPAFQDWIERLNKNDRGLFDAPLLIPALLGHNSHSAQHYICHLIPLVAALLQCTKNAIHIGHFGTIGKSVQKIFLMIAFNFVD